MIIEFVGKAGSGKTTLSHEVAVRLKQNDIEFNVEGVKIKWYKYTTFRIIKSSIQISKYLFGNMNITVIYDFIVAQSINNGYKKNNIKILTQGISRDIVKILDGRELGVDDMTNSYSSLILPDALIFIKSPDEVRRQRVLQRVKQQDNSFSVKKIIRKFYLKPIKKNDELRYNHLLTLYEALNIPTLIINNNCKEKSVDLIYNFIINLSGE